MVPLFCRDGEQGKQGEQGEQGRRRQERRTDKQASGERHQQCALAQSRAQGHSHGPHSAAASAPDVEEDMVGDEKATCHAASTLLLPSPAACSAGRCNSVGCAGVSVLDALTPAGIGVVRHHYVADAPLMR